MVQVLQAFGRCSAVYGNSMGLQNSFISIIKEDVTGLLSFAT
jgi:hypothetical protein